LTAEALRSGQQVLVFCPSRSQCSFLCKRLSSLLPQLCKSSGLWKYEPSPGVSHQVQADHSTLFYSRKAAIEKFAGGVRGSMDGANVLWTSIEVGIAYHHAGLSDDERDAVERLYLSGNISVLLATSTLAAGM